jgi:hypothetical protein
MPRIVVRTTDDCNGGTALDFCEACWKPTAAEIVKLSPRFKIRFTKEAAQEALTTAGIYGANHVSYGKTPSFRCDICRTGLIPQDD